MSWDPSNFPSFPNRFKSVKTRNRTRAAAAASISSTNVVETANVLEDRPYECFSTNRRVVFFCPGTQRTRLFSRWFISGRQPLLPARTVEFRNFRLICRVQRGYIYGGGLFYITYTHKHTRYIDRQKLPVVYVNALRRVYECECNTYVRIGRIAWEK